MAKVTFLPSLLGSRPHNKISIHSTVFAGRRLVTDRQTFVGQICRGEAAGQASSDELVSAVGGGADTHLLQQQQQQLGRQTATCASSHKTPVPVIGLLCRTSSVVVKSICVCV